LFTYVIAIVYISLYPLTNWHNNGIKYYVYLKNPFVYWTKFDIYINVLAYIPLGFILYDFVFKNKLIKSFIITVLGGILLSFSMETLQNYIPNRVPSLLDIYTNTLGAIIGWFFAYLFKKPLLSLLNESEVLKIDKIALFLLSLWPILQINQQNYLFSSGKIYFLTSFLENKFFNSKFYLFNEIAITFICIITICFLIYYFLKNNFKLSFLIYYFFIVLFIKINSALFIFKIESDWLGLTIGNLIGIFLGFFAFILWTYFIKKINKNVIIALIVIQAMLINILPNNPYLVENLIELERGKFFNLNTALQFLSTIWLYLMLFRLTQIKKE
jgi:glycopeptide antibiotics resistance protein